MIAQELIKELFIYRDGRLFRKVDRGNQKKGTRAGALTGDKNYWKIWINGKGYYEHQLVWLYHKGYLPKQLDHKDYDGLNNRIENLREATTSQNMANAPKKKNNSTGFKGVHFNKKKKKYYGRIMVNRENKHLGWFCDPIEAAKAYNTAAIKYFGEFARLNSL